MDIAGKVPGGVPEEVPGGVPGEVPTSCLLLSLHLLRRTLTLPLLVFYDTVGPSAENHYTPIFAVSGGILTRPS